MWENPWSSRGYQHSEASDSVSDACRWVCRTSHKRSKADIIFNDMMYY